MLALPNAGQAQVRSYCEGRIVTERFTVLGSGGSMGRSNYSTDLRNTRGNPIRFVVIMSGDALGRPVGQLFTIPGNGRLTLPLGYHPRRPGVPPLTPQQLAEAVRISCS